MEDKELKRSGDVYREVKVGAVADRLTLARTLEAGSRRVCGSSRPEAVCRTSQ